MKRKKVIKRRGRAVRRSTLVLTRKAQIRRGARRKTRKLRYGKTKRGPLLRKKRRLPRKQAQRVQVVTQPPVQVVPVIEAPPAPQVVPLPPDLGVPPETPPGDAFQQGYTEAYNVGFDAGFAKGFEDGHKLELG